VLRVLGLGAAGAALGGVGALSACSNERGSASGSVGGGAAAAGSAGSTTSTRVIPAYDPDTPYWLQGDFAPVADESTVRGAQLRVTGSIPSSLSGLYVRNGSNPRSGTSAHWFLGDGMVHGVRLEAGKATWYRNRYVQTPYVGPDAAHAAQQPPGGEVNQSNVALVHHAGKLLSTGEVGWPYELSTTDLSTVGAWDFDGRLGPTMTAHPKIDPETGWMHFFGYEFLRTALTYYAADPSGRLAVVSPIPVETSTMIHDFAITDRDAVFWIGPVVFGPDPQNPDPTVPFHWEPDGPCKVGVMPLGGSGDQIRWVDVDPCFVFHGLNAHRDGDDVVVRVHKLAEAFGRQGDLVPSHLTEWRIATGGGSLRLSEQRISERSMDLPAHDRRHTGRPTRHGWCATVTGPDAPYGFELAGICHVDTATGREQLWEPGTARRAGEGFFVADGPDAAEGEGWVLSYVWDRATNRSSLAIFDALAVAQGPVAEVHLPVRVPFGFHGLWVPESDL
jgi:carotenoid cleavage dioxygenase